MLAYTAGFCVTDYINRLFNHFRLDELTVKHRPESTSTATIKSPAAKRTDMTCTWKETKMPWMYFWQRVDEVLGKLGLFLKVKMDENIYVSH